MQLGNVMEVDVIDATECVEEDDEVGVKPLKLTRGVSRGLGL